MSLLLGVTTNIFDANKMTTFFAGFAASSVYIKKLPKKIMILEYHAMPEIPQFLIKT